MAPHDFAIIVEDDVTLHDDLSVSAARAAILHGFDLARSDGWLYLGICQTRCKNESWFGEVSFAKCGGGVCSHAIAVTKHRAATLIQDLHTSMVEDHLSWAKDYPGAHSMDRMLSNYADYRNGTWVVGTNLNAPAESETELKSIGLFYQDRARFHSTIGNNAPALR